MSHGLAISCRKQSVSSFVLTTSRHLMIVAAIALAASAATVAQSPEVQQKFAAAQQAAAQNKARLRQYQWTETTQITLNGEQKPPSENLCQYGPDGQVQKTPIGPPPQQPSGGRFKQRVIEKKKGEIEEYMDEVKGLLG